MKNLITIVCCLIVMCFTHDVLGQKNLNKSITIDIKRQPLKKALIVIGNEGDFKFSYNSKILPKDSIVNVYAENKKVLRVLRTLFDASYDFKEVGDYVIIRRKVVSTKNVVARKVVQDRFYYIKGYVVDEATGEKIANATIYEKMNLLSAMTDENGYFSLKLKKKYKTAEISISRENYIDTTVNIVKNYNQQMTIALQEVAPVYLVVDAASGDTIVGLTSAMNNMLDNFSKVEGNWIGRIFLGSKQKLQSLNLKRFYTTRSWQLGFVPPISTHGRMNAQVVNKVSVNMIGGYSRGTDLMEIGGVFNINKSDVKYFQAAGVLNNVGGKVEGMQIAGVLNRVQDSVIGFQAAGIANMAKTHVQGTQFSGIYSHAKSVEGIQLAGLANVTEGHVKGVQWAGIFNRAGSISGIQLGLINIVTDANTGSSFGLINISKGKKGRRRIGFLYRAPRKG